MSTVDDSSQRLTRLARILNDGSVRNEASATDAVALHLGSVRLDRIKRLTREIADRTGHEPDELDGVAMRLLLEEYVAAVAHLRAVAREGAKGVALAPAALKDVRRYVEAQEKRRAAIEPSDQPHPSQNRDR